jgi:hypothetical protein
MSDTSLEQRIETLEKQMQYVLQRMQTTTPHSPATKDWRKSLGMCRDSPIMKQIDKAGQLIRQQDREA